jgi:acetoin utilization protein AcuC
MSQAGEGFLDFGDTPAFPGIFDAAMSVVGTTLRAGEMVMSGRCRRAFVPIAGLHHAARVRTSGFIIEALRKRPGIRRIAYVDIDAYHGAGVFYGFADDPDVLVAVIH